MSLKTQGTELFFINPDNNAVVKLNCPTGITGLGGPADQIEDTCLDATSKSFKQGLKTPSQVSIPFNFDPAETSHRTITELFESGETTNWMIALSDGTGTPTADSDADFVSLTSRTNVVMSGYIADLNIDVATNENVRGTLSVQRSGSAVWTYKV